MSNVISIKSEAYRAESLESLWDESRRLANNGIFVWLNSAGMIEVTLKFARRSGTRVEALGKDMNFAFAIANAINEAREMGAE